MVKRSLIWKGVYVLLMMAVYQPASFGGILIPKGHVAASDNTAPSILFIFDASGSMWQKMGTTTKIQIARETMKALQPRIPSGSQVGLIAYGHRSATDCQDIETLIPVGPMDASTFIHTIQDLDPKGKTPIAGSIQHALDGIKKMTGPVSVVLISDGLETCDGDACELVKQARNDGISITMHVIGFGISEVDQSSLECLAQAGGGLYVPAINAEELAAALAQTIEEVPEGNAFLSVKTTKEGKPADASVKVMRKQPAMKPVSGRTYISSETNPRLFALQPGLYDLEVSLVGGQGQNPMILQGIDVKAQDTVFQHVEFSEGEIIMHVTRNGELSDGLISVYQTGTTKVVATARSYNQATHNPTTLRVPPGQYDITVSSVEISSRPEKKFAQQIVTGGGRIELETQFASGVIWVGARQGETLIDATVSIIRVSDKKNVASGRTYKTEKNNPADFIVEPGSYEIQIAPVSGSSLPRQTIRVELNAGETLRKTAEW